MSYLVADPARRGDVSRRQSSIKENYCNDVFKLTAARKDVERLLGNRRVHQNLAKHHEDTLLSLEQLITQNATDTDLKRLTSQELATTTTARGAN